MITSAIYDEIEPDLGGIHKLRWQDFGLFFDQLPTPVDILFYCYKVKSLYTFEISSTTYLPRLVNVVCERPPTIVAE